MTIRQVGWIFVLGLSLQSLFGADAAEYKVGAEYDIVLEDGEELTRAEIREVSQTSLTVRMRGLAQDVAIPRAGIRSARIQEKQKLFRRFDLGVFADFHLSQADLRQLTNYFPGAALALNIELGKRFPVLRFNAISAELDFMYISPDERRVFAGGAAASPRWQFKPWSAGLFAGLGGGLTVLYLKSFTFSRWGSVPLTFAEVGAFYDMGESFRLYGTVRGNLILDSQTPLWTVAIRFGVSLRL